MFEAVKDFMGKLAPPNYVPGLGRGASGFTTRSDIGPAREAVPVEATGDDNKNEENERYQDPDQETGLFSGIPYEADDLEADKIYDQIDQKLDERRKSRREAREREELLKYRKERPKIQQQFADLKRGLKEVTEEEWQGIPEVGDLTGKNRKKVNLKERFAPVPDSVLERVRENAGLASSLDPIQQKFGGMATPAPNSGMQTNFIEMGQARDRVLGLKLDQMSDSKSGQSTVDPRGYLTDLNSVILKTDAEIGDIKKARLLLKSVTGTNPSHAPGWIAAARLEEVANKLVTARQIMAQACEQCPTSEDVWLEAARLNVPEHAKVILANAVRQLPHSVKIWMHAAKLEIEPTFKKRVYRRALELIPNSLVLWQAAIRLEDNPEDAKVLLSQAVKLIPTSIDLWLALARLESYNEARKVIQTGSKAIPTSHEMWIAAAQLVEENGEVDKVDKVIKNALKKLTMNGAILSRETWIKEAERCELELKCVVTAQSIIRTTIGLDVDKEDELEVWLEDGETSAGRGAVEVARAIYANAIQQYPEKEEVWLQAAYFEKEHGTRESLDELLDRGVKYCPQAEILWLMRAKELWQTNQLALAQKILELAFKANPQSEQIFLAASKLEIESQQPERAQKVLAMARSSADTERVWLKSITLERILDNHLIALELVDQAILKFSKFEKFHMIKGQILTHLNRIDEARQVYLQGLKLCPNIVPLWVLASNLELLENKVIKARALLERARKINPKSEMLWYEAIQLELKNGNENIGKVLLAKALQECSTSGLLWSKAIDLEPRPQRKSKVADALKHCDHHPLILITMANLFINDRKYQKAIHWLFKAIELDLSYADSYVYAYKVAKENGTKDDVNKVLEKFQTNEPTQGLIFPKLAKLPNNYFIRGEKLLQLVAEAI